MKGKLPAKWSAQCWEIYALLRGLKWLEYKKGTIYTDSKYAYGVAYTFGNIWVGRGFVNSKGKTLVHENLIKEVLEALKGPLEIAVVHIRGHQRRTSMEVQGNNLADQTAKPSKKAALEEGGKTFYLTNPGDKDDREVPIFSEKEQEELQKHGAVQNEKGEWNMPYGRQVLNKVLARKILENLHASTHWGTQALHDHFVRISVCIGAFEVTKIVMPDCMICQQVNRKVMRKMPQGGRELARRPFQNIQVDFTELPQIQRFKYLLVLIDHLTH